MKSYILRLDDACEYMCIKKWEIIENILSVNEIKPLVGIIPRCRDRDLTKFEKDPMFWNRARRWQEKGWTIGLHGYEHVFHTDEGGINPVNSRSEFAGLPIRKQEKMIEEGYRILLGEGLIPKAFFAPAHTFDDNTIIALLKETDIRVISDTPATNIYKKNGITIVPQQAGRFRTLPFKFTTFCYHPNNMDISDFDYFEDFLNKNNHNFISFPIVESNRNLTILDRVLMSTYYYKHKRNSR